MLDLSAVRALVDPGSVLVVGASRNTAALSGVVMHALRRFAYRGRVAAVNPKYDEIQGFRCYRSLDQLPAGETYDLSVVAVARDQVPATIRRCGELGVRAAVVISAGFAEAGEAGKALEDELRLAARKYGMAVCGPNCAGIANFAENLVAYGTNNFLELDEIVAGGTAVLTASGGLGNTIFSYLQDHRVGCSKLISMGNEAVTTAADYVEVLVDDASVDSFVCYLESIKEPEQFFAAVERAHDAGKPVVVLRPGRTRVAQEAMITHTAALSGRHEAYDAWFRRHGVVAVDDLDELAETIVSLQRIEPTTGDGVGIFSLPGGGLGLLADHAYAHGFTVPALSESTAEDLRELLPDLAVVKNPLDPSSGFRDSPLLGDALVRFGSDPNIDLVVFFPLVSNPAYADQIVNQLLDVPARLGKPLVCIWTVSATAELESGPWRRLRDGGIALYSRTSAAFQALERQRRSAAFRQARELQPREPENRAIPFAEAELDSAAKAFRADPGRLLNAYGLRTPRSCVATCAEAAVSFSADLETVVSKISSPDIPHKSELGLVRMGLRTAEEVRDAYRDLLARASETTPGARILGVEIQEQVPDGVEVLLGVTTDEQLGSYVVAASGGVLTELVRDAAHWPAPLSRTEAVQLVDRLRVSRLLAGYRGSPPSDRGALVETLVLVSYLAADLAPLRPEIDLNPVIVGPDGTGVWIVDAHVEFGAPDVVPAAEGSRPA